MEVHRTGREGLGVMRHTEHQDVDDPVQVRLTFRLGRGNARIHEIHARSEHGAEAETGLEALPR